MKKIARILILVAVMFLTTIDITTVSAARLSSDDNDNDKNVCQKQTHYYYFTYPAGAFAECTLNNEESTCDSSDWRETPDSRWNEVADLVNHPEYLRHETTFGRATLPEGYKLLSLQTEATTDFSLQDYYILVDGTLNTGSGRLTSDDVAGIYDLDSTGSVIVTQDSDGNSVYHHIHGSWSGSGQPENTNSIFERMRPRWNALDKNGKIAYRESVVNGLYNATLPSTAIIGVNINGTFQELTNTNMSRIFDATNKVVIQRTIDVSNRKEPMLYESNADGTIRRYVSYPLPSKFEVVIGVDCHEKTCDDVNAEYDACTKSNTCSDALITEYEECNPPKTCEEINEEYKACSKDETCSDLLIAEYKKCNPTCDEINEQYEACSKDETCSDELIAEYEECNPIEEIENPKTSDLNIPLICLVITGMGVLAVNAYQQKKKELK